MGLPWTTSVLDHHRDHPSVHSAGRVRRTTLAHALDVCTT